MKFILILLILLFVGQASAVDISSCGTLSSANTTYNLIQNVTSTAGCFIINANGIVLDGNNYYVNFSNTSSGYGIQDFNRENVTIKNINLYQGNRSLTGIQRGVFY